MTLPLKDVQKLKIEASKPGGMIDEYIKIQDINSALNEADKEFCNEVGNGYIQSIVKKIMEKWLRCK